MFPHLSINIPPRTPSIGGQLSHHSPCEGGESERRHFGLFYEFEIYGGSIKERRRVVNNNRRLLLSYSGIETRNLTVR
jgi:hypothetical protein